MKNIFNEPETRKIVALYPFPIESKIFMPMYLRSKDEPCFAYAAALLDNGKMATLFRIGFTGYMLVTDEDRKLHAARVEFLDQMKKALAAMDGTVDDDPVRIDWNKVLDEVPSGGDEK